MQLKWVFLLAANFANSLFMAFLLLSMYLKSSHTVTLIEPNELIIAIEAVFSIFIVASSITVAAWNFLRSSKTESPKFTA